VERAIAGGGVVLGRHGPLPVVGLILDLRHSDRGQDDADPDWFQFHLSPQTGTWTKSVPAKKQFSFQLYWWEAAYVGRLQMESWITQRAEFGQSTLRERK